MPLPPRQRPLLEDIERRILYSADTPAGALASTLPPAGPEAAQAQATTPAPTQAQVELVVLDARVADADLLLADIAAQVADGRQLEVLRVDADADGVAAIGAALAGREDVAALHIVSHGGAGEVLLGREALDSDALLVRAADIAGWGSHLAAGADILLYGCDVAGNDAGRALVQDLAALTGADVAASTDRTGAAPQGGNWTLEMQTGAIEAQLAFGLQTQAQWQGLLATYTVTSTADSGAGTLRQAITDANANAGADTIVFNIAGAGLQTINLSSALPTITGALSLNGYTQSDAAANSASTGSNAVIRIALNGAGAGAGANGLNFGAGSEGSSVRGLAIGGFSGAGILTSVGGLTVAGNFIGTNAAGTAANANATGISVAGTGTTTIGSATLADRNLISGNTNNIVGSATGALTIHGNLVGTNNSGSTTLGTPTAGISISAGTANAVGGANAGEGNVIAGGARGVVVTNAGTLASIVGNTISQTTVQGIDLANDGATANDAGDTDTGPNALQNFPVLTGAQTSANGYVAVQGTLNSTAGTSYRIDFYASPSGTTIREGRVHLGYTTVTTDASGNVSFAASLRGSTVAVGDLLSATATRMGGTALAETSEFSAYQGTTAINVQTVTTTAFTGPGSLGAAIDAANAASGPTLIRFNIAGTGLHTITFPPHDPDNPQYYRINKQVIIDGSTDDSFAANGNQPAIQIDASGGENVFALRSGADGSTIHGLAFTNLYYTALYIEPGSDNNVITGNYIGTIGAGGQMLSTSTVYGIWVDSASHNRIGGSTAADRNVFTGITGVAITVSADSGTATGNLVQGNYIGVMPDGLSAVNSPGQGIQVATPTATNTRVLDNWIARTDYSAISVNAGATGTTVQGNRIGTDATGTANWGVRLAAGIFLSGGAANNLFQNNVVAFSGANGGILLAASTGTGNAILANQIYSNTGPGIDLGFNGVTANDTGDADTGANDLQNFPVLTLARTDGAGSFTLSGTINTTANTYLRIELFSNPANDSTGYGEGQTYLGFVNVLTDGSGNASFSTTLSVTVAVGAFISATATKSNSSYTTFSDTSEFARSVVAISTVQNTLVVDTNADTVNGDTTSLSTLLANKGADGFISLREALIAINNTPAGSLPTLVNFGIAGTGVHTITLGSELPAITRPVVINGTTDDSFAANSNRPAIVLQGNGSGSTWSGLSLGTGSSGSTVRGLVIRGFDKAIYLQAGSSGNSIVGNYLGPLQADGSYTSAASAQTTWGVLVEGANNTIGGTTAADRNVIAGAQGSGANIGLQLATATGNRIVGNYLGTNASGTPLGLGGEGVYIRASAANNQVGGTAAGEGNLIAGSGLSGVSVFTGAGSGNAILSNSIHSNGSLGINLDAAGVTANDTGDADTGPNNLQNFPVLTLARTNGSGSFEITGSINSTANTYIRIELFASTANDPSGYGEGQTYLGFVNVLTDGSGNASFSTTIGATVAAGAFISATATRSVAGYGSFSDTSEFAKSIVAISSTQAVLVVDTAADTLDGDTTNISTLLASKGSDGFISLREALIAINNTPAGSLPTLVNFGIADTGVHTITLGSALPAITRPVVINGTTDDSFAANSSRPAIVLQGNGSGSTWFGLEFESGSGGSTVRGLVIRGFYAAIYMRAGSGGNTIVGNYIGPLQADGSYTNAASARTTWGVEVASANNTIGGTTAADRNVISGMLTAGAGVSLETSGATGNRVIGNYMGTDANGTPLGVGAEGVITRAGAFNNTIGGTAAGEGNLIAGAALRGIWITPDSGAGNAILGNSIYSNAGLGIDLGNAGVTPNDPGDADTGPNNLQNFPVLTLARTNGAGSFEIAGSINSTANTYIRIELFASTANDPSGYGEGQTYLGFVNVLTDGSGNASFSTTLGATVAAGAFISATATRSVAGYSSFSDTSEFARSVVAIHTTQQNVLVVTTAADTVDGDTTSISTLLATKGTDGFISLREALIAINNTPANGLPTLLNFAIAGTGVHDITLGSALPAITRPVFIDGRSDDSYAANGNRPAIVLQGGGYTNGWVGLDFQSGSSGSTVRGLVVQGFEVGIYLRAGSDGNTIAGNYIGPLQADGSYTGTAAAQTTWGVIVSSANNTIGGTTVADRNVVSGLRTAGAGIYMLETTATGNRIIGNYLGANASGTPLGVGGESLILTNGAHDNRIGGTAAGEGNLIAGSQLASVWLAPAAGGGNAILSNTIHSNGGLGIDLGNQGVTPNDTGDADTGPNNLQNFPVLATVGYASNQFTVMGSLNSEAGKTYRIEFFGIPHGSTDGSGNGEGNVFLGFVEVTTDASGNASFSTTLAAAGLTYGAWISSTATEKTGASSYGSTSEFSANVQAANTAPVITVPTSVAYTENAAAVALAPAATVVDTELAASGNYAGATLTLRRNGGANAQDLFAATGGSLSALTQGGNLVYGGTTVGTVTTNSGGSLVLGFNSNATQTLVNNVLRAIGYANSSDAPPASVQLDWSFSDGNTGAQGGGGALAGTGSTTVNITAVNDAPVVTTSGGMLAYTENAAATVIDTGLTVSDVDNVNLTGATVTISANYANGQDVLAFVNANGITGSWNAATGVLTLSGTATVANYQAALRSVTYVNTSDNPSTATRTVSFVVSDGAANSAAATRDISVTAVNDAPVLTTTGSALAYTENAAATAVDAGLSVSDADSTNLTGATVSISANYVNGEDVLAFTNQLGITGSWNAATGVLTLSGTTTVANYQTALRSITYVNTSENPDTATRTVSFVVNDGTANSTAATRDVSVAAVNDAPVVTTTGGTTAYTENAAPTAVDPGLTVSDADSTNLAGATVTISANYVNGQDLLAFVNANGITGSWDAATGVLTLSGGSSLANYQAALRSITYVNTSDNPGTATRTVSFVVSDGTAISAVATRDISVTAINNAPVVTTTAGTTAYTENAPATAVDPGVTVSDADNTTLTGATVTIGANYVNGEDMLAFVNANGITGSWNATTGTLTLSGSATVTNYQAALRSVTYANTSDNPSTATRTVSFVINDGTATSAAATRDISVTAINNAPVVTTTSGTTAYTENTPATAIDPGLTVSDVDNTTLAGATVTISANYVNGQDVLGFADQNGITGSWNAATGTLTLSGSSSVANYQTALRSITYANTSDNPSTTTRTVSFMINDGTATSAAATRDISVTAINNAPVVTTTGGATAYTENAPATAVDPGVTVSDADNTTLTGATVTISANYVNGEDMLAFVNANGITGSWSAATGTLTLSGTATVANYQAALRSITYANTNDNPSTATRTVSFTVNDGSATSAAAARDIAVTAVNNAPVVTTTAGTTAYTENAPATAIDTGLTVSDTDSTNLTGATVTISTNYANGQDVLGFVDQNGITGSWNAATGVLTLSGSATVANYQAALRSITYANTSDNPSTATRTVSFVVNDGTTHSAAATRDIAVTAVNNAPVITSNGGGATAAISIPENTTAVTTVTATDVDSPVLSYSISGGADAALFSIDANTGVLRFITAPNYEAPANAGGNNVYAVVVQVSDGSATATQAIAVTVTDVAEFGVGPVTDVDNAPNQVPENAPNGTAVGITAHATDPDALDTVSYSLGNSAGGRFAIDAVTGVVTVANGTLLDYETATSHQITVIATSSDGSTSSADFTITLTDVNEAPVGAVTDADPAPNQVPENAANGTAVGIKAQAIDPDGTATVSYSLSDNAGGRFAINATTGVVTVANASLLDHETATSHQITVLATSSDGSTSSANFTIAVTDVSETAVGPVTDVDATPNTVPENAPNGTAVGITAHATDPDALDTVSYSLGNSAGGRFTIDAVTGVVTVANGTLLDYESVTSHQITVVATSSDGSTSSADFTITLADMNEAPVGPVTDADPAPNQVPENAANGTAVGIKAQAVDPDGTATVSYSLSDDAGGRFAVNATTGVVTVANASLLDHGTNASHSITVLATSSDGSSTSASFSIAVLDAGGAAVGPISDTDTAGNQVQQGAANGSTVGITALAVDPDGDSVAYSLHDDAGGRFTIDATTGVVTVADGSLLDAAVATSHAITVRATSADGSFSERIFNIAVLAAAGNGVGPVNDTDPAGNHVAENAANGTSVGITAQALDPDGDAVHYTLSDSAGGRFTIDATTGVVTVADGSRLDYEAATSHRITVLATSADGSTSSRDFTILLGDVNEFSVSPLIDVNSAPDQVRVPAANGTPVGITAFAQDRDGTDTVYYSLSDSAAGRFAIHALTGVVTVADSARVGDATGYTITVRATSTDGSTSERSFSIGVPNANVQPPAITSPDRVAVPENTSGTVLRVTASDPDSPADTLVYSIAGGADAARFTIDARTGELRFAVPPDYEQPSDANADNRYELRVRVSDGRQAAEQALRVEVTPVNDNVPRFSTPGGVVEVDENTVEVTQLQATDDDRPAETLHYSIVGGADAARFTVDAQTGALRFVQAPDYEAPDDADRNGHYELVVAVSDGMHSSTLALTVRVRDVPDSPPVFPDSTQHVAVPEMQSDVTTVTATDPDNLVVRYSIAGGPDGALFAIDAESGRLWFLAPPQFLLPRDADGNNVYEVLVQASNAVASSTHTVFVTVLGSAVGTPTPTPVPTGPQPQPGAVAPTPVPTPAVQQPAVVQPSNPGTPGGSTHEAGGDYGSPAHAGQGATEGGGGQLPLGAPDPIFAALPPGTAAAPGLGLPATLPPMARAQPPQPHTAPEHPGEELSAGLLKAPVLQPYVDVLVLPGVDARRTEVELVDVQVVAASPGDDANALREAQAGLDEALIGGVVISLGAAFWATRGGALLASLLTMSPAWVHMDPLPVLSRRQRADRKPMPPAALAADGPEHNGARPAQAVAEDKT